MFRLTQISYMITKHYPLPISKKYICKALHSDQHAPQEAHVNKSIHKQSHIYITDYVKRQLKSVCHMNTSFHNVYIAHKLNMHVILYHPQLLINHSIITAL